MAVVEASPPATETSTAIDEALDIADTGSGVDVRLLATLTELLSNNR